MGKVPYYPEKLQEVFERIGIGSADDFGNPYEEWFITDYDCYVDGLYNLLGEYENLDELNYLASKLEELGESEYEHFQAAMEISDYTGSLKDLINLTDNLDKYDVYPALTTTTIWAGITLTSWEPCRCRSTCRTISTMRHTGVILPWETRELSPITVMCMTIRAALRNIMTETVRISGGIPRDGLPEEVEELEPDLDRLDVSTELALDLDLHFRGILCRL